MHVEADWPAATAATGGAAATGTAGEAAALAGAMAGTVAALAGAGGVAALAGAAVGEATAWAGAAAAAPHGATSMRAEVCRNADDTPVALVTAKSTLVSLVGAVYSNVKESSGVVEE